MTKLFSGALIPSERQDSGKMKARPELFTLTSQPDNNGVGRSSILPHQIGRNQ